MLVDVARLRRERVCAGEEGPEEVGEGDLERDSGERLKRTLVLLVGGGWEVALRCRVGRVLDFVLIVAVSEVRAVGETARGVSRHSRLPS